MSKITVNMEGQTFEVDLGLVPVNGVGLSVKVNGEPVSVVLPNPMASVEEMDWMIVDGRPYEIICDPDLHWIRSYYGLHTLNIHDQRDAPRPKSGDGRIKAPIPGQITRVFVEPGQSVTAGQPLLILEAMKMENQIRAPFDGVVQTIQVSAGQVVRLQEVLVEVA
mgnify:CR=1 FL=1